MTEQPPPPRARPEALAMLELLKTENPGDLELVETVDAAIAELKRTRELWSMLGTLVSTHGWSLRAIGPDFVMMAYGAHRGAPKQVMHKTLSAVIRAANFLQNGGNPR